MRNPIDSVTGRARRISDGVRQTRAAVTRPRPPVQIDIGRAAPVWVLRLVAVALGVLAVIMLDPGVVGMVVCGICLLVLAVLPNPATGALFCGVLAVFWMIMPSEPFSIDQYALLALGPAVWTLAGTLSELPLRTRFELRALRTPGRRYLVVQVITQALLAAATALQSVGDRLDPVLLGVIAFACTALLAAAAWLILPRLAPRPPEQRNR